MKLEDRKRHGDIVAIRQCTRDVKLKPLEYNRIAHIL
jgi:hypothetical protein